MFDGNREGGGIIIAGLFIDFLPFCIVEYLLAPSCGDCWSYIGGQVKQLREKEPLA